MARVTSPPQVPGEIIPNYKMRPAMAEAAPVIRVFHEARDTAFEARGAGCPLGRREFQGFHETRNTAFSRYGARIL